MNKHNYLVGLACLMLSACGSDNHYNNEPTTPPPTPKPSYEFSIKVVNLTYGQPLSPIGIAMHSEGYLWYLGEEASSELEILAESGANSDVLATLTNTTQTSGEAPLGPGKTQEFTLISDTLESQKISLISMIVNTNDGFTGLNAVDVSAMRVGDAHYMMTHAYDAGTELNSELSGTIPGPADGGEGFNQNRDDIINKVAMHSGVVGNDDGLNDSVLDSRHKFDNPLMAVTITRTK